MAPSMLAVACLHAVLSVYCGGRVLRSLSHMLKGLELFGHNSASSRCLCMCRVQFDRRELGVELVKDVDVMPIDPTENLAPMFAPMMVRL